VRARFAAALAAAAVLAAPQALGQAYPTKPIRIIVPYAAGGTSDILGLLARGAEALRAKFTT